MRLGLVGLVLAVAALTGVAQGASARPLIRLPNFHRHHPSTDGAASIAAPGEKAIRVSIMSDGRQLDGFLMHAGPECRSAPAVLIFHGVDEHLKNWSQVQTLLRGRCISSLVFDTTGRGYSYGERTHHNLNDDAFAAYDFFTVRFPTERRCVLGFSAGVGPMLDGLLSFDPAPACVVIASAQTDAYPDTGKHRLLRSAQRIGVPRWRNTHAVRMNNAPLLVVHSDADRTTRLADAEQIYQWASGPKTMIVLHGFNHDSAWKRPTPAWWATISAFLRAEPMPGA